MGNLLPDVPDTAQYPLPKDSGSPLPVGTGVRRDNMMCLLATAPRFGEKYVNREPSSGLIFSLPYSPDGREDSNLMSLLLKANLETKYVNGRLCQPINPN